MTAIKSKKVIEYALWIFIDKNMTGASRAVQINRAGTNQS